MKCISEECTHFTKDIFSMLKIKDKNAINVIINTAVAFMLLFAMNVLRVVISKHRI